MPTLLAFLTGRVQGKYGENQADNAEHECQIVNEWHPRENDGDDSENKSGHSQ